MEKNINEDLDQVLKWSQMDNLVISQTKTKCMFVVEKRLRKRLDNLNLNLNISLNGSIIDQVKSHKLLGIHLDHLILILTFKRRFYVNRYQRKLVFSST